MQARQRMLSGCSAPLAHGAEQRQLRPFGSCTCITPDLFMLQRPGLQQLLYQGISHVSSRIVQAEEPQSHLLGYAFYGIML